MDQLASARRRPTALREALLVGLAVAACYAVLGPAEPYAPGSYQDDGVYLVLGKAVASGEGYRSIHLVGEPVQVKYPPGLPALLAVLWWIGGSLSSVLTLAGALNLLVAGTTAGLLWWFARSRLELSPILAAGFAVGPFFLDATIQYYHLVLSEPYHILGWAVALVLFDRLRGDAEPGTRLALAALLGLVLAGATLFRTQAVVLVPAFLAALLVVRAPWRVTGTTAAAAALPLLAWRAYHARLVARGPLSTAPDEVSYAEWIPAGGLAELAAFAAHVLVQNVLGYILIFSVFFSSSQTIGLFIVLLLLAFAAIGAVRLFREQPALVLSTAASLPVFLLWPFTLDRFAIPTLFFLGLLVGSELQRFERAPQPRLRWAARLACVAAIAVIGLRQLDLDAGEERIPVPSAYIPETSAVVRTTSDWIVGNTERDERVLTFSPGGVYLATGRQTVNAIPSQSFVAPHMGEDPAGYFLDQILRYQIAVVVVTGPRSLTALAVESLRDRCPDSLRDVTGTDSPDHPRFFRMAGDLECLGGIAERPGPTGAASGSRPDGGGRPPDRAQRNESAGRNDPLRRPGRTGRRKASQSVAVP